MRTFLTIIAAVLLSWPGGLAGAVLPAVAAGAAYLASMQAPDGAWSTASERALLDSLAAVMALRTGPNHQDSVSFWRGLAGLLVLADERGREDHLLTSLARAAASGELTPTQLQRYTDGGGGGWAMEAGARADVTSTVFVLEVLLGLTGPAVDGDWPEAMAAVDFLLAARQPDGWWRLSEQAAPGDFRLSCRVAVVLAQWAGQSGNVVAGLQDALAAVGDLVAQSRQDDGLYDLSGFGFGDIMVAGRVSLYDAAVALRLMCLLGRWEEARPTCQALQSCQNQDGGWGEAPGQETDLQTTCAALAALSAFRLTTPDTWPDLMVTGAGVAVRPASPSGEGASRLIEALVFNQGSSVAASFRVAFYRGFATAHGLMAELEAEPLQPGCSSRVRLVLTEENLPEWLVVVVDADGRTGDLHRENNWCRCFLGGAPGVNEPDTPVLGVLDNELLLNGARPDEVLFLGPGQGVAVSGLAVASGATGAVQYAFQDNGRELATGTCVLDTGPGAVLATDWFPEAGTHVLRLILTGEPPGAVMDAVTELVVTVVDEGALLQTWQQVNGSWQKSSMYPARDFVEIEPLCADAEAEVTLWVEDVAGVFLGAPVPSGERPGRYHWHTGAHPPGAYRACGRFRQRRNGALLAETTTPFDIMPTDVCSGLVMTGIDRENILACGQTLLVQPGAQWQAVTNVAGAGCQLTWHWEGEDGTRLDSMPRIRLDVPVDLQAMTQRTALAEALQVSFAEPGLYWLLVELTCGETRLRDAVSFLAVARPVPVVENLVAPECVEAGLELVTTRIRLTVADAAKGLSAGEPATFSTGPFAATVDDDSGAAVQIPLLDIRDRRGVLVDGGVLVSRVEYGRCRGDADLAPSRTEGSVALHQISQGCAQLDYAPTGSTLRENQWATVVIAIHLASQEGTSWGIGRQIGSVEVYLTGVTP